MRRPAPRLAVPLLAATLLLTGCLSLGGEPIEMHRHAIDPVPAPAVVSNGPVLAVRSLEVLARYERRVVQRGADGSFGYLEAERWVDDPADAVRVALRERLLASGRFSAVVDAASAFEADLVLEGTLLACDLVETGDGPAARLALGLVLADASTGHVLHEGAHEAVVPLASGDTRGLGAAMTAAVGRVAESAVTLWSVGAAPGMLLPPPAVPE